MSRMLQLVIILTYANNLSYYYNAQVSTILNSNATEARILFRY